MDWEEVGEDEASITERAPVPGGWLYRTLLWEGAKNTVDDKWVSVAMAFVPAVPE
jgi:hypothetical protein